MRRAAGQIGRRVGRAGRAVLTAAVLLAAGCVTPHGVTVADTNPFCWERTAELQWSNDDTLALREFRFVVRHNQDAPAGPLRIAVEVTDPDSLLFRDTLHLQLTPPDGRATLLSRETILPYRRGVRFARTGCYRVRFTPAEPLRGIEAVGIEIVNTD